MKEKLSIEGKKKVIVRQGASDTNEVLKLLHDYNLVSCFKCLVLQIEVTFTGD